ncbi:membrane carboxypeptidase [Candidatus Vecturithrix granuli]|uniref:peptidoglycan glycosyltransferase n=1 Tax=Vecturithrix granuli TaxID=1499967 RepID=A0A081C3N3_VECG1|nr:membrane carboxypeptidase [Candidatus Vecturithrix granuli]
MFDVLRKDMRKSLKIVGIFCLVCATLFIVSLYLPLSKDLFAIQTGMSLKITDRHGILLRETLSAEGGRTTWLQYDELPESVVRAIVATEDKRFFSHIGVDVLALGRALWQNVRSGHVVSGASTITQQLVKMRFGYPRTIFGKLQEMWMALRVERQFSKQDILAQYLNRVSFSNQAYGIEAASRLYFGKPARHLSFAESVFLAGLIQAPSRFNPYRNVAQAIQRQQALLERMYQRRALDETQYQLARQEEIRLIPQQINFKAPHFCYTILESLIQKGRGEQAIQEIAEIKTTLDYYLQEQIENIVAAHISELDAYNVTNAAVLVLENTTGDILAYMGSRDFFNDAISGQVNGVLSLRQPGSTLKPFTYQLALERFYTPATLLPDILEYPVAPRSFLPENYDRKYHGPVRLREALACSYNIPAVRVLETIGVEALYQRLHEFGFESLRELPTFYGPGLTLGNGEVTLLELTRAYSTLARRGKYLPERAILEVKPYSPYGTSDSQPAIQKFSPRVIYLLTHILADRQSGIAAFGENTALELPFQTAVKTGTSKDYRDNWTIGFTRDYTIGIWVGNFDGSPMRKVSGITGAAPIYRDVMLTLYRDHPPMSLLDSPPPGIVTARICPLSGDLVAENCPHGLEEFFLEGTEPTEPCKMHQAYWVDERDDLLTEPNTPHSVKKVFLQFPPLYQSWAHDRGYPTPPTQLSPYARIVGKQKTRREQASIRIVRPNDGDVYAIDPVLRREYQTLQLSAVVPSGMSQVVWYVNDEPWESVNAPFRAAWAIAPGAHRIYAEGELHGEFVRSREITVHVVE